MRLLVPARVYRQFDADPALDVPAEAYGGWTTAEVPFDPARSALVVMHAWDPGTPETHAAWWRTVEYLPRARRILAEVFPSLLAAVRASPMPVFHVVGGPTDYYSHLPGYRADAAGAAPEVVEPGAVARELHAWREDHVFVGARNRAGVARALDGLQFAPQARPVGSEGVARDGAQLLALCRAHGVDHLVYVGFALNWCLLMSPGGMVDMQRHGLLCSTVAEAVTAVENRETAREEREKQQALWRVALAFGFVFGLDDLLGALAGVSPGARPADGAR
jgi:nicotinamidase-related amidase